MELTDELLKEGMAREIINRVQNLRKDGGLEITDRIRVTIAPHAQTDAAIAAFGTYIQSQVLADELHIGPNNGVTTEFEEFQLNIQIEKITH